MPATKTEPNKSFPSLPLAPLWDVARSGSMSATATSSFTATMFAEQIGHNIRAVTRWKETGTIPWISADVAACRLGFHPLLVWGDDWLNIRGDFEEIASGARDAQIDRDLAKGFAYRAALMEARVLADLEEQAMS